MDSLSLTAAGMTFCALLLNVNIKTGNIKTARSSHPDEYTNNAFSQLLLISSMEYTKCCLRDLHPLV